MKTTHNINVGFVVLLMLILDKNELPHLPCWRAQEFPWCITITTKARNHNRTWLGFFWWKDGPKMKHSHTFELYKKRPLVKRDSIKLNIENQIIMQQLAFKSFFFLFMSFVIPFASHVTIVRKENCMILFWTCPMF
jgi:hypothetical protein